MKDKSKHLESTGFESSTLHNLLILFLKCDVTTFWIPPPLSHNATLRQPPPPPFTCNLIYR